MILSRFSAYSYKNLGTMTWIRNSSHFWQIIFTLLDISIIGFDFLLFKFGFFYHCLFTLNINAKIQCAWLNICDVIAIYLWGTNLRDDISSAIDFR